MIQLPKHSFKRGRIIAHAHHFGNSREQPFVHVQLPGGAKPAMLQAGPLHCKRIFTS